MLRGIFFAVGMVTVGCVPTTSGSAKADETAPQSEILSVIKKHCAGCHGTEGPEGDLTLAPTHGKLPEALRNVEPLEAITKRLRSRTMPPPDAKQPLPKKQRQQLIAWLDAQVLPRAHGGGDDLLDACACAWSARRFARGETRSFPQTPDRDARGLRMEIRA